MRDCPDVGRRWGRCCRAEVVVLLGVMDPGSPEEPGKGMRGCVAVDNAREIHRGGKYRLKGPEIAGTLPPLADQFRGFPA
jgi:hypothetical protein